MSGNNLYESKIRERVKAALAEKEKAFAAAHANDTDRDLLDYLRKAAALLGHTPRRWEFVGWWTIERRFNGLDNANRSIGLHPYMGKDRVSECDLIQQVTAEQRALYRKEKQKKKQLSHQRRIQQEKRRRKEEAWLLEHDPEKYYRKINKKLKRQEKKGKEDHDQ